MTERKRAWIASEMGKRRGRVLMRLLSQSENEREWAGRTRGGKTRKHLQTPTYSADNQGDCGFAISRSRFHATLGRSLPKATAFRLYPRK